MRLRRLIPLAALAACVHRSDDPPIVSIAPGDVPIAVTAPAPVDEILIFEGYIPTEGPDVLTPKLLAAGARPAVSAEVWPALAVEQRAVDPPRTTATLGVRQGYTAEIFGVRHAADGSRIVVGVAGLRPQFNGGSDGDIDQTIVPVELAIAPAGTEIWGADSLCARIPNSGVTLWSPAGDQDCDGRGDFEDCNPAAYCDPASPNPSACETQRCVDGCPSESAGLCMAGNQATCHDDLPAPATVTCDAVADDTCPAATACMPSGSCTGGGIACPALNAQDQLLCDIVVDLPYPSCSAARVIDAGGPPVDWTVDVQPPCIVTLAGPTTNGYLVLPAGTAITIQVTAGGVPTTARLVLSEFAMDFCTATCGAALPGDTCQ